MFKNIYTQLVLSQSCPFRTSFRCMSESIAIRQEMLNWSADGLRDENICTSKTIV